MSETEGQPSLELDGVLAMDRSGSRVALLDTEGDCQLLRIETAQLTVAEQRRRHGGSDRGLSVGQHRLAVPMEQRRPRKTPARPVVAGILLDCHELPGQCWVGGRRGCALTVWHIEEARQLGRVAGTGQRSGARRSRARGRKRFLALVGVAAASASIGRTTRC